MSPIADIDMQDTTVTAALTAKSRTQTVRKARWDRRSEEKRAAKPDEKM
jgi:hypothetical protein